MDKFFGCVVPEEDEFSEFDDTEGAREHASDDDDSKTELDKPLKAKKNTSPSEEDIKRERHARKRAYRRAKKKSKKPIEEAEVTAGDDDASEITTPSILQQTPWQITLFGYTEVTQPELEKIILATEAISTVANPIVPTGIREVQMAVEVPGATASENMNEHLEDTHGDEKPRNQPIGWSFFWNSKSSHKDISEAREPGTSTGAKDKNLTRQAPQEDDSSIPSHHQDDYDRYAEMRTSVKDLSRRELELLYLRQTDALRLKTTPRTHRQDGETSPPIKSPPGSKRREADGRRKKHNFREYHMAPEMERDLISSTKAGAILVSRLSLDGVEPSQHQNHPLRHQAARVQKSARVAREGTTEKRLGNENRAISTRSPLNSDSPALSRNPPAQIIQNGSLCL